MYVEESTALSDRLRVAQRENVELSYRTKELSGELQDTLSKLEEAKTSSEAQRLASDRHLTELQLAIKSISSEKEALKTKVSCFQSKTSNFACSLNA